MSLMTDQPQVILTRPEQEINEKSLELEGLRITLIDNLKGMESKIKEKIFDLMGGSQGLKAEYDANSAILHFHSVQPGSDSTISLRPFTQSSRKDLSGRLEILKSAGIQFDRKTPGHVYGDGFTIDCKQPDFLNKLAIAVAVNQTLSH